jgi:hypothetical protein
VVSLIPLAVSRLSGTRVPGPLELAFVFGMALQFASESTKLFEIFYYWDKLVHPTLVALTGMICAWLLLGYRDAYRKRLPLHLIAAISMLLAITIGAGWEFIEFGSDWFENSDLQKSTGDTITDILANDTGAFVATLLALYLYRWFSSTQRDHSGRIAAWLAAGPTTFLRRHGRVVGIVCAVFLATVLFLSQWVDRGVPALADLAPGAARTWHFDGSAAPPDAQVLSGDWVPDPRGICRENLDNPKPGSEKAGVLELTPGSSYGGDAQAFTIQARFYEERPAMINGSEMDAGIAFGIRDADNFDLVEQNALHDVLRLDAFVHDRRRDLRDKLYRTHGDEWHTLQISVSGGTVTAGLDGEQIYTVMGVPRTDGPIGLWARAAAATCFSDVSVAPEGGQ